ncbi:MULTISPECIES: pseudouridine synthase [Nitrosomonas]|uniref:Dual-specificity RNA pseudouridine synthase RluF n=2 Tax=Nitrosomonas eutropha TaxID=916 RepID=A0ABX5M5B8_9PROT|nr:MULTISPECIES: pseudouridine synthase [Nitrosomonas]ABI58298.1 ribosomal large subunit pseudouridine synthase F [Nitrosomonas eutropha C91]MXS80130.1 rRNA pseudouridine synthase [Nitrosomonas sp. GH22]PXV79405.1 ribosomal large subunit pseudouridine synthase F [Nitrosomonas eutropha]SCX23450.1 ribosomal large subunit pseudouridine synthase F [Nitrosomonas eutropha]SDW08750.1 ribosomal large subunit pseudouridine synthase F [Nitrosomonas eutropha]
MEKVRLSKLMSAQGMCSRREADVYIEQGWVYVDGQPARELGTKIYPWQEITLDRTAQIKQNQQVTILLNKPVGYVSGQPELGYKPAASLICHDSRFHRDRSSLKFTSQHLKNLAPAGRLDIDSQGLLVFTQDGRVAKQLIGEYSRIEKEYLVRVIGNLTRKGLALLNHGLQLDGQVLKPAKVSLLNQDQLRFILQEGKKRQIRRMCELVGLNVSGLKRVRIGQIRLADLPEGKWRYLGKNELF